MLYSEFIEGTGCQDNRHNFKVFQDLEVMYMNSNLTKEQIYEYGKKLVDNTVKECRVHDLPWLVISDGPNPAGGSYVAAAFLNAYAAECYVEDHRQAGNCNYRVLHKNKLDDEYDRVIKDDKL